MRLSARRTVLTGLLHALSLAATACGDDSDGVAGAGVASPTATPDAPTSGATPEAGDCARVITPDVLETLGWQPSGGPEEALGGCEWVVEDGLVVVASEDGTLERACAELKGQASGTYDPDVDYAGEGRTGCADRPEAGLGLSTLLVAGEDGRVWNVRVAAKAQTDPGAVQSALTSLATTATGLASG